MLRRPLDLARVGLESDASNAKSEGGFDSAPQHTFQAVEQYVDYVKENIYSSNTACIPAVADLCLPLYLITEQLRDDYNEHAVDTWLPEEDMESIYDILREATEWLHDSTGARLKKKASADYIELKKISDSFKGLVGTKVANKWKRNRAEL